MNKRYVIRNNLTNYILEGYTWNGEDFDPDLNKGNKEANKYAQRMANTLNATFRNMIVFVVTEAAWNS